MNGINQWIEELWFGYIEDNLQTVNLHHHSFAIINYHDKWSEIVGSY